jgi:hypothetical protein
MPIYADVPSTNRKPPIPPIYPLFHNLQPRVPQALFAIALHSRATRKCPPPVPRISRRLSARNMYIHLHFRRASTKPHIPDNAYEPSALTPSEGSRFVAPSTTPTTLYRLLKNVIQSFKTFCLVSSRSSHSGLTSSGFVDVRARAREASWPANTVGGISVLFC